MTIAICCFPPATVYKCDPTKELLTVSSSKSSTDLSVPQILALSQLSAFFLVTYSRQHLPSQNYTWCGSNFTGQTIILMRSLRVLISGSPLRFPGSLFLKVSSSLVLALLVALTGPSNQGESPTCPKSLHMPNRTYSPESPLPPPTPPSLSGISPGQNRVWGGGVLAGAEPWRFILRRILGPAGKENHLS